MAAAAVKVVATAAVAAAVVAMVAVAAVGVLLLVVAERSEVAKVPQLVMWREMPYLTAAVAKLSEGMKSWYVPCLRQLLLQQSNYTMLLIPAQSPSRSGHFPPRRESAGAH